MICWQGALSEALRSLGSGSADSIVDDGAGTTDDDKSSTTDTEEGGGGGGVVVGNWQWNWIGRAEVET